MITEEADYEVTLVLRISTVVRFAPIGRERPITKLDAIDNAIGSIPEAVFAELHGEGFAIADPIDGEASKIA